MSQNSHTLGPTCLFHHDESTNVPSDSLTLPRIKAHFFYVSSIPIDDPLSPLPPVSSDTKSLQYHKAQPFSVRDNAALAEAWQGIRNLSSRNARSPSRPEIGKREKTLGELVRFPRFRSDGKSPATLSPYPKDESHESLAEDLREVNYEGTVRAASSTDALSPLYRQPKKLVEKEGEARGRTSQKTTPRSSIFSKFPSMSEEVGPSTSLSSSAQADWQTETDISGRPFARAPIFRSTDDQGDHESDATATESQSQRRDVKSGADEHKAVKPQEDNEEQDGTEEEIVKIPVGVSRLHLVEMPDLLMKPIYWNPANDISAVLRGTWFYASSMLPVEPDLANWLETGYQEFKPWTNTWQDELNSCVEIGAEAEMKVVYHLFPEKVSSRPGSGSEAKADSSENLEAAHYPTPNPLVDHENLAAGPQSEQFRTWAPDVPRRYKNHRVIYVNATRAQILRPSLAPSVSRNRKPLAAVRKGREIGVPVVRGFDRRAWEKLNASEKMSVRAAHAKDGAYISQSGQSAMRNQHPSCPACAMEEQKRTPKATDLVLVIHGIGQKLSEKMDSFNFTHAINSFRREVNVQLSSELFQGNNRKEQGGIMVLPINWRLTVSFDDKAEPERGKEENTFQLEDITPDTLPAVRSLISDVMLDIPYYLSHHKQKMISAVIKEANKVYRLWCHNNPDFHVNGRVHLIAHSLGSAMALDILSQQPTKPPSRVELSSRSINEEIFEFDTKSLFCCGSPAGFFLLLNRATLVPRRGRHKPGIDREDERGITGEAGTYGCLAIDNIYNVMAPYDPISYKMNAAVDSEYAASLKPAIIPAVRQGLFASIGLRWGASRSTRPFGLASSTASTTSQRPTVNKLPSTIELDTHNFTREELAEKRMYLLNDNGQIDFTLSLDGGPLDFQYWNMLSAHSSYWLRQDFVRFLVVEIGREQGRQGTLAALKAQKKRVFKAGQIA